MTLDQFIEELQKVKQKYAWELSGNKHWPQIVVDYNYWAGSAFLFPLQVLALEHNYDIFDYEGKPKTPYQCAVLIGAEDGEIIHMASIGGFGGMYPEELEVRKRMLDALELYNDTNFEWKPELNLEK